MNLIFSGIILKFLIVIVFYITLEEINTHLKNIEKILKSKEVGNEKIQTATKIKKEN